MEDTENRQKGVCRAQTYDYFLVFGVWYLALILCRVLPMANKRASWVMVCMGLARMILHSREMRRKILMQLVLVLLVVVALGAWPLSGWLGSHIWLFLIWWGISMIYGLMIILLAIYDMLAVVTEERGKSKDE
ncbi:hypothetical protein HW115_11370 [Verrucomicrobiaceae bacterium N1E253]|uniref:Transmembrane protein n=1 Tax=Oceaniferula marina TaxID=2748318 RepID=A0A851GH49_9BACT|nr:hypothetical protein [Oceaniferula marina]NWK56212.1 hypothetical protein [Oceaniferula marina]